MEQLEEAGEDAVMSAVRRYVEKIKRDGTEEKYIMHGSTFFNGAWRDYAEDETATELMQQQQRRKSL